MNTTDVLPIYPLCRYYLADVPLDEFETETWVEAEDAVTATYKAALLWGPLWSGTFSGRAWQDPTTGRQCQEPVPDAPPAATVRALVSQQVNEQ